MGGSRQVYVDLAFQGRLRKNDELVGAEVFLFTRLLEEQGSAILDVPGYCLTVPSSERRARIPDRVEILIKILGVWTTLWLEVRHTDVFVLYDRSRH